MRVKEGYSPGIYCLLFPTLQSANPKTDFANFF